MQRQAHHRAALRALLVELVELRLHHRGVARGRRVAQLEQRHVVDLERIRHADQAALAHLHRHRLVVVHEVERVLDALFRQHVLRRLVVGDGGRQPAVERLAAVLKDGLAAVGDQQALLVLRQVVEIARVVGAVAEQLPAQFAAALDDLREVIAQRHVQRHRAAHAMLGHRVGHAPEARAVAVVAMAVIENIRHRPRPRHLARVIRRLELVMLDVGRQPHRDPRAVRPHDLRPARVRCVVVMSRFRQHRQLSLERQPADTIAPEVNMSDTSRRDGQDEKGLWPGLIGRLPKPVFVAPMVVYWLLMALRYRSVSLPSAANPAIELGGAGRRIEDDLFRSGAAATKEMAGARGSHRSRTRRPGTRAVLAGAPRAGFSRGREA